jgi:nucleoside-diphosphate-sugar epimerase
VVHSVPPLEEKDNAGIHDLIQAIMPRRILYISSTGVYGSQTEVDADTPVSPNDEKGRARMAEENWIAGPPGNCVWSSLILRSAAIYGPGRGIHVRLREGKLPRGAGGVVSRIHVDDLAAILQAGIDSQLDGAWPVADDYPAASEEVADWCAEYMDLVLPSGSAPGVSIAGRNMTGRNIAGRSVDGTRIRQLLEVKLKYASYRTGIPASLLEEGLK